MLNSVVAFSDRTGLQVLVVMMPSSWIIDTAIATLVFWCLDFNIVFATDMQHFQYLEEWL